MRRIHVKLRRGLVGALEILLGDACVKLGYCSNRLSGEDLLGERRRVDGDSFALAVLIAEGMNPELEKKQYRTLKKLFCDRFGETVSEADYVPR